MNITSPAQPCPLCGGEATAFDVVDFTDSCVEGSGTLLPLSGIPVCYLRRRECGFCFARELHRWKPEEVAEKIFNDDDIDVDPDWIETRPRGIAQHLAQLFGPAGTTIRHLDYGGGIGLMSDLLQGAGWQSTSYDPFVDKDVDVFGLGKFDLITSFEVFEHVPDATRLLADLVSLLADDGLIYFSTLHSENQMVPGQRLSGWCAAPRNGHISLYTRKSLALLGARHGLGFSSFNANLHAFRRRVPAWAQHLFPSA